MKNYLDVYKAFLEAFGFDVRPLRAFALLQVLELVDNGTRLVDELLYPGYRNLPIDRPIFILGNPRSGTTFLHKFLLETDRLAAFALWEMLLPAISAQNAFEGLVDRFAPLSPAQYHGSDAHQTSLRDVETDDVAATFRYLDGGFAWFFILAFNDEWGSERSRKLFDESLEDEKDRLKLYKFMEGCWRKSMYRKRKSRFVAKSSLFTLRTRSLLQRYPDCKLIYMVRDPLEVLPSGASLITGVLERSYSLFEKANPEALNRYMENIYQASVYMYRKFDEIQRTDPVPEKNLRIVTYPSLLRDLEGTVEGLIEFLELEPAPAFFDKLKQQVEKQRSYQSEHKYSLDKYVRFGFTEERIRKDLAFVYDRYDVELPPREDTGQPDPAGERRVKAAAAATAG